MATKPTKRILDWASSGTATDPGGAKEAAGWIVSERPPAFWWNWILQSFGDWLSWAETSIDEIAPLVPIAAGAITVGSGPSIQYEEGIGINTITYDTPGAVIITFDSAVCNAVAECVITANTHFGDGYMIKAEMTSTTVLEITAYTANATQYDLETAGVSKVMSYTVRGTP